MNLYHKLKSFLHFQRGIVESTKSIVDSAGDSILNALYYKNKVDELNQCTLNSSLSGTSTAHISSEEVIVSLTTHSYRLYDVYLAIESIMQGTMLPNRIILWLSNDYRGVTMPVTLQKQMKRGLEVRYCEDIRSYTKLLPALAEFPDSSIVTIDDDIIYPMDMLELLVNAHNASEKCICANWIHYIPDNLKEKYVSLLDWPMATGSVADSPLLFFEGFGGVLYPPDSLAKEVFDRDVFLDICRFADDVWFNAMSLIKGTKIRYSNPRPGLLKCLGNKDVQSIALRNVNSENDCLNDIQIKNVFDKYGVFDIISKLHQENQRHIG